MTANNRQLKSYIEQIFNKNINRCEHMNVIENIRFISSGSFGSAFMVNIKGYNTAFVMKIVPYIISKINVSNNDIYKKYNIVTYMKENKVWTEYSISDQKRPENIEAIVHEKLSELFKLLNISNHITTFFVSFQCDLKNDKFNTFIKSINRMKPDKFVGDNRSNANLKYNKSSIYRVLFSEYANYGSLNNYLNNNELTNNDYLILFFQVISVFSFLEKYFPSFRHNDLHFGNILVKKYNKPIVYRFSNDEIYQIKNPKFSIMLNDFDYSVCHLISANVKFNDMFENNKRYRNCYNDIHTFFNFVYTYLYNRLSKDLKEFVLYVIPSVIRGSRAKYKNASICNKTMVDRYFLVISEKQMMKLKNDGVDLSDRFPLKLIKNKIFKKFRVV